MPDYDQRWIEWTKRLERPCLAMHVGGSPTQRGNKIQSVFGEVNVCATGEAWPTWRGKPLWPLCQLNLTEAPWRPDGLADVAILTIFISPEFHSGEFPWLLDPGEGDAASWCLRTYSSVETLVPLVAKSHGSSIRPSQISWGRTCADMPTHDLLPLDMPTDLRESYYDQKFPRVCKSKLGGWPTCVQSEPWWSHQENGDEYRYALQIDSEQQAGWSWGDCGVGYFARSHRDPRKWAFDWQCY